MLKSCDVANAPFTAEQGQEHSPCTDDPVLMVLADELPEDPDDPFVPEDAGPPDPMGAPESCMLLPDTGAPPFDALFRDDDCRDCCALGAMTGIGGGPAEAENAEEDCINSTRIAADVG